MVKPYILVFICLVTIFTSNTLAQSLPEEQLETNKFVNIIYPVRSRDLWSDKSVENVEKVKNLTTSMNLSATWLLQYDVLFDQDLLSKIDGFNKHSEIGAFLEVSEKLATDAHVAYKLGDGDYYRTDKVLLSGYSPIERERLIDTYISKFKEVFKSTPSTVGSWYIDSRSQSFLAKKGVTTAVTVADQYDTDGASVWGKYYGMPFYPSKYNSLEPASTIEEKISIVNIQWAQRDITMGYGRYVKDSRQSFQANDYINNGFDSDYFDKLLNQYLSQKTDFMQITVGLETGQEASAFYEELKTQLIKINKLQKEGQLKVTTAQSFGSYYLNKYQGLSPSHLLTKNNSFWFMSPQFRVAVFEEDDKLVLKDLRYYNGKPSVDYLYADNNSYLNRKVDSQIDKVDKDNQLTLGASSITNLVTNNESISFTVENNTVKLNAEGLYVNENLFLTNDYKQDQFRKKQVSKQAAFLKVENFLLKPTNNILYSNINEKKLFGLKINNFVIGFYGAKPGVYKFPSQTLTRFISLNKIVTKRTQSFLSIQD